MSATQKCRTCRSPLRPCKCQRARLKAAGTRRKSRRALVAAGKTEIVLERARRSTQEAEEWARQYHSEERREWVGDLPCCFCGKRPTERHPSENHHTWTEGTGRKGPYWSIVPLCQKCHRRYHTIGKLSMLQARPTYLRIKLVAGRGKPVVIQVEQWAAAAAEVERLWIQVTSTRG